MYNIDINNTVYSVQEDMNLIDYLRDEVQVTSLKNGCGEGACGACMLLVDGKAMRACILTVAKASGKKLLTVEGLSEREKEAYTWAFAEAGAVQCGFCIPGMIISAKALLDKNDNPTSQEIKQSIRGNICRCTGYIKIEQGIFLAAQVLRGEIYPKSLQPGARIGTSVQRVDAREKAMGTGEYVDDMHVDNMLYAAVLRTKYPRALVKNIDVSAARAYPGVEAALTAEDIPADRSHGHIFHDWPTMVSIGEETRYIGDAIAIVAAQTKKQAREALDLIKVDYEELKPILSPTEALADQAPRLHQKGNLLSTTKVKRGNTEEALAKSAHVVTNRYTTPPTEHAFMEPESALAIPQKDGGVTVYVGDQSVYDDQHGIMAMLGLPAEKVRVISKLVGGGFGGKEDLSVQHHAALLAIKTKKPVKLTFTRQESILVHPKRHAMEMEVTTGCDAEGRLTAMVAKIVADTGAYASLGTAVLQRACTHASGPYQLANVDIVGQCVYTNNPPAGAFRGFGVPQSSFAAETNMDLLAEKVGISPWEIRYLNALEPGMVNSTGQITDEGTAIKETLRAVREVYESHPHAAGIACAMKNTGIGVGLPDTGRVKIKIMNGKALVLTSAACIGQGFATIATQIVHEATGLSIELIEVGAPDTCMTPNSGTTTASRQTMFSGEAVRQAALKLQQAMHNSSFEDLDGYEFDGEYLGETDPMDSDKPNPISHVAYSYATHVVLLNEQGLVEKVVAAHDVGRAINPKAIEGQIEGGVCMGLGYALREDFPLLNGVPTTKYAKLGLLRSTEMPEVESVIIEKNSSPLAYGAKGVGEIASIPTAPAVASAYYKFDGKLRCSLPLQGTPYKK
ncbi:selenium-dependent xanthine dehydrogenase [Desulfosporosinus sp. BICA1-9]|uniref:selenium-dependent xanthine dehydrogenase n=1 Tax=Desulfosporosinus sp. BICA1-9 TaxID=1531958 RepID=UPI00054B6B19|nr:selenium-dependent xanthine dehydrogenase [Desulfosporosinus sp. BICA1-9]KJS46110.1 MAG: aldehyde oxidoreductase [Peptococcaceae bacterium BRH_c23]KJS88054.1 MAG: aldehyde oxidoreductase [Desulfosporosinus sp. BICA1-9]HBW34605.1 selenium-dependent xanthine dehydrogenase [Desulfosporosinus sp.]